MERRSSRHVKLSEISDVLGQVSTLLASHTERLLALQEESAARFIQTNDMVRDLVAVVDEVFGRYELIERRVPTLEEAKRDIDEALGLSAPAEDLRLRVSEVFKEFDLFLH